VDPGSRSPRRAHRRPGIRIVRGRNKGSPYESRPEFDSFDYWLAATWLFAALGTARRATDTRRRTHPHHFPDCGSICTNSTRPGDRPGCAALTAAKIIGIDRFRSKDSFARHNGTAPLPVLSSNRARHRLSRTGNRQLYAAIHRIALTQARCHEDARALLARRKAGGDGGMDALRVLKRRLSDVVFRAMVADQSSLMDLAA
jgi:transposase